MLVLTWEDFMTATREIERKNRNDKINFIKDLPIFSKLSRVQQTKFANTMKIMNCYKNQTVFKQGDEADRVFIILDGLFEITKKLKDAKVNKKKEPSAKELLQILNDPIISKQ